MQNKLKFVVLWWCAAACGAVMADSTAESLTKIEAETSVLKARAKKLEVQAQIANKQAEIERLTGTASIGDPVIRSVEGVGSTLYATLQLENGSLIDVREGDVLPNGMKVVSIRVNEVIAESGHGKRKRRVRLGTAGAGGGPGSGYAGSSATLPVPALYPAPRGGL